MSMRPVVLGAVALLLFFGPSPGAWAEDQKPADTSAGPSCSDCHEQAKTFATNPHGHGKLADGQIPNAVCESCHGDGTAHMEAGGDKEKILKPVVLTGADMCLKCHDAPTDRITRHGGMHSNTQTVNCLTCHSIHAARSPHLLANDELSICGSCHSPQASSLRNKPYAHRLGRGGMSCTSCHEPHGRPGKESLRQTSSGEQLPCYSCHAEKRGPYVFQHPANAVGGCTTCHEPHGSVNPKQLRRANVGQLCIECHSPITAGTLGSQPPSFHNLSSPRYQNCTTCHVAVHGSNRSPQLFK